MKRTDLIRKPHKGKTSLFRNSSLVFKLEAF